MANNTRLGQRKTAKKKAEIGQPEIFVLEDRQTSYLAVVFLTYSSMLSISGLIVEIIVAKPAAYKHSTERIQGEEECY